MTPDDFNTDSVSRSGIEVISANFSQGPKRAAIFDFDGTLSLLRRNWQDVMIPMMVDELSATGTAESQAELHAHVEEYVMRLNGRQTVYQMMQLAEEVTRRGGTAEDPLVYKHRYHEMLWRDVGRRIDAVRSGRVPPDEMMVPAARRLLQELQQKGLELFLASGTDLKYVRDELGVLELGNFFGDHVYGALDDYKRFSKALILNRMIREVGIPPGQIVAFGDGYVEIEEIKRVGGLAVGVASNEESRSGVNDWKRQRLVQAGADLIIGDYCQQARLLELIGIA